MNLLYDESCRNKKVVIVGRIECAMDEMESLMDDLESKGWKYVSGIATNPAANQGYVKYGHYENDTGDSFSELIEPLERAHEKRVTEAQNAHWQACEEAGRSCAGEVLAKEMGYTGRDAEVFLMGFTGVSAKVVNPRQSGCEEVFRAGREAWWPVISPMEK